MAPCHLSFQAQRDLHGHLGWRSGRDLIAPSGGAGAEGRSRTRTGRSSIARAHPLGPAAPLPRGEASTKVYRRQFRRSGCHRLIHPNVLVLLEGASPAKTEPEVGFEPTTFRLRVETHPSSRYQPGRFWLLTSAASSVEFVPDLSCYGRGNDRENDRTQPSIERSRLQVQVDQRLVALEPCVVDSWAPQGLSAAVQGQNDQVRESVGEQDDGDAGEQDAGDPVEDHARLR
jgi:hypothetical protein